MFTAMSNSRSDYLIPDHLKCLGYALESARLVFEKRFDTWLCPKCIYCCSCKEFIYDPENVQCFACDEAFHGICRSTSGAWKNPKDPLSNIVNHQIVLLHRITPCKKTDQWGRSQKISESDVASVTEIYSFSEVDIINDQLKDFCRQYLENQEKEGRNKMKQQMRGRNYSLRKKITAKDQKYLSISVIVFIVMRCKIPSSSVFVNALHYDALKVAQNLVSDSHHMMCRNISIFEENQYSHFYDGKKSHLELKVKWSESESESAKNIRIVDGVKISIRGKQNASDQLTEAEKHREMKNNSTAFDYNLYTTAKREFRASQLSENLNADEEKRPQRQWIQFGSERLLAKYLSPYPERIAQSSNVYICRFCLVALEDSTLYEIHRAYCEWKHPPGNEIYRDDRLSFWEIDGIDEIYSSQFIHMFINVINNVFNILVLLQVETFLFYVLTEYTEKGYVPLGYFSKEKNPSKNNNLSCLLTFPSSQRTGYGKFLIDLSYKLSLRERKIGGPEHPLSDMGLITYRSYWKAILKNSVFAEMSHETGIYPSDIINTMLENKMLKYRDGNYLINRKKALTAPLRIFRRRVVHDEKLIWEPEFDVKDPET
ncbi:MOZ/SAS family protein [Onchocerca flexuosa]|uniref:Histone acetyltransferase n=1 Tax=Onchocerca flexuosa TaxID=387005 RepID=A0A238C4C2_9BILA|nr:MOZ/SAS family protein [Onchocerca flexuosa]